MYVYFVPLDPCREIAKIRIMGVAFGKDKVENHRIFHVRRPQFTYNFIDAFSFYTVLANTHVFCKNNFLGVFKKSFLRISFSSEKSILPPFFHFTTFFYEMAKFIDFSLDSYRFWLISDLILSKFDRFAEIRMFECKERFRHDFHWFLCTILDFEKDDFGSWNFDNSFVFFIWLFDDSLEVARFIFRELKIHRKSSSLCKIKINEF